MDWNALSTLVVCSCVIGCSSKTCAGLVSLGRGDGWPWIWSVGEGCSNQILHAPERGIGWFLPSFWRIRFTPAVWDFAFITSATIGRPTSLGARPELCRSPSWPSLLIGLGFLCAWSMMNSMSAVARFLYFSTHARFRTTVPACEAAGASEIGRAHV